MRKYFFDTSYHLNSEGAALRTQAFCITRANERKGGYYGNQSYKQSISLNERLAVINIDEKILVGKYVIL